MTLQELLIEIRALPIRERKLLINLIVETLPETDASAAEPQRSISELRGLGKEIWQGIDAQAYVDELRREWDQRP